MLGQDMKIAERCVPVHSEVPSFVMLGFIYLYFLTSCAFILFWFFSNKASSKNTYVPPKLLHCVFVVAQGLHIVWSL